MSSFVFTGSATISGVKIPRVNLVRLAQEKGHAVISDPEQLWKAHYLVTDHANSNTRKALRAKQFGTKIITPEEFLTLCGGQLELRLEDLL